MIYHLVLFAVKEDASESGVEDLLSSLAALEHAVPSVVDFSVGEDFSGRAGEYTHALFARFEDREGLQEYLGHPEHLAVVEKLDAHTTGRLVADYEA
jgi:quinol monooxygenase YgiN